MNIHRKCPALLACSLALATGSASAEDWSRFRGPNGSGIVEDGSYPAEFGPEKNLIWKTAARPGKSSPVLTEKHIFLTAFDGGKLYTQCFSRETGKLLWERSAARAREADINGLNEPAANSPVTDGENVYVVFRDVGLISYDASGEQRWRTPLDPLMTLTGYHHLTRSEAYQYFGFPLLGLLILTHAWLRLSSAEGQRPKAEG